MSRMFFLILVTCFSASAFAESCYIGSTVSCARAPFTDLVLTNDKNSVQDAYASCRESAYSSGLSGIVSMKTATGRCYSDNQVVTGHASESSLNYDSWTSSSDDSYQGGSDSQSYQQYPQDNGPSTLDSNSVCRESACYCQSGGAQVNYGDSCGY